MSGDVVNLRQFRKQKARSDKEKAAEQNRIAFGRTKAEKTLTRALNEKAEKTLDQGRLERPCACLKPRHRTTGGPTTRRTDFPRDLKALPGKPEST